MIAIKKQPSTTEKLSILSQDSQYDLACACGTQDDEHRRRSREGTWIYPVAMPQGGTTYLFKTLLSNECVNDCKYCPLRAGENARRCRMEPEELARVFLEYYQSRKVSGLFLSSGVMNTPDATMERINATSRLLRRRGFRGYIHLKIIPGASELAIREALSLSSAVSLNIETAGEKHFKTLSKTKDYQRDIINSIKFISRLTQKGAPFSRVKQTTQFVVGAAQETDREIVSYAWPLYKKLGLHRIYFSAYQEKAGKLNFTADTTKQINSNLLTREHRLYQVDWLLRKYRFKAEEIPFEKNNNLSLAIDPKEAWAKLHPELFPIDLNKAGKFELLRVPGIGEITADHILKLRANGCRIRKIGQLGRMGKLLQKATQYVKI